MRDYSEKRAFPRMQVDCPARIRLDGDAGAKGAVVKDLSGGGLLIWLDRPLNAGESFDVTIEAGTELTRPLHARVRVVRCKALAGGEGSFAVACQIQSILD